MITEKGSEIMLKFLLKQTQEYAKYLAIGCGYNQLLGQNYVYGVDDAARESLRFEMTRVPIISSGIYIDENSVKHLVFKAELPAEQRFKITEVGVFPDSANVLAGAFDSKRISGFLPSENWVDKNSQAIDEVTDSIVNESNNYILSTIDLAYVADENAAWDHPGRKRTLQPPRYFDRSILLRGDTSTIHKDTLAIDGASNYIKTNSILLNMNENSATDLLKLAFALIPEVPDSTSTPANVMIGIDFLNDYSQSPSYARYIKKFVPADFIGTDTEKYYYKIHDIEKQDFTVSSSDFSWASINGVKIYVSIKDGSNNPVDDWYVLLDGLRLENITAQNPLYSLVGYKVIDTDSGQPVIKRNNTVNFIEFMFSVDI